jgi:hypothetical protein
MLTGVGHAFYSQMSLKRYVDEDGVIQVTEGSMLLVVCMPCGGLMHLDILNVFACTVLINGLAGDQLAHL